MSNELTAFLNTQLTIAAGRRSDLEDAYNDACASKDLHRIQTAAMELRAADAVQTVFANLIRNTQRPTLAP